MSSDSCTELLSEFHHNETKNTQKEKRELFLSTKLSWTKLDDDFPTPQIAVDHTSSALQLVPCITFHKCPFSQGGIMPAHLICSSVQKGRFRQLEILGHVTSAFSSLLSHMSTRQQKIEEGKREEKARINIPKGKPKAKKRRIGQVLRKISRQTHESQTYQNAGICKTQEDYFVDDDLHLVTRTGLSDSAALISLKELLPNEEEEESMIIPQSAQFIATKTWGLPQLLLKEPQFPSKSDILSKERSRKEHNLLLTHTLRRLSSISCKPSDSFEMEEIQSFEDETFWGNPLENISDAITTRTSSCQSDSSGFLEDSLEPLPLQVLPLPITMRVSCSSHDYQEFSQHKQEYLLMTQDYQPQIDRAVPNISIVENTVSLLPSLSEENTLQGEENFYSINEDDISCETYSGQSENVVRKSAYVLDKNEMQCRRGQREKEDDCLVQDSTSAPERNNRGSFSTEENSISPLIRLSGSQSCQGRKEHEKPLRGRGGEEGGGKDLKRSFQSSSNNDA